MLLLDLIKGPHPLFNGMSRIAYTSVTKRRDFAKERRDAYMAQANKEQDIARHVAKMLVATVYDRLYQGYDFDIVELTQGATEGVIAQYANGRLDVLRDKWPNIKLLLQNDGFVSKVLPDLQSDLFLERVEAAVTAQRVAEAKKEAARKAQEEARKAAAERLAADKEADRETLKSIEELRRAAREAWAMSGKLPRDQVYAAIVRVENLQRSIYFLKARLRVPIAPDPIDEQRTG